MLPNCRTDCLFHHLTGCVGSVLNDFQVNNIVEVIIFISVKKEEE